jgi:hypothetical protein
MNRPFEYTLSSIERLVLDKLLIRICAITFTLFAVGFTIAYFSPRATEVAAARSAPAAAATAAR